MKMSLTVEEDYLSRCRCKVKSPFDWRKINPYQKLYLFPQVVIYERSRRWHKYKVSQLFSEPVLTSHHTRLVVEMVFEGISGSKEGGRASVVA